jgi:hypothetical protein
LVELLLLTDVPAADELCRYWPSWGVAGLVPLLAFWFVEFMFERLLRMARRCSRVDLSDVIVSVVDIVD